MYNLGVTSKNIIMMLQQFRKGGGRGIYFQIKVFLYFLLLHKNAGLDNELFSSSAQ